MIQPTPVSPHRYREVEPGDHPDKGQMGGHCNTRACQKPGAVWYNTGTDSYYCSPCAVAINRVNRDIKPMLCVPPGHKDYVVEVLEPSGKRQGVE